MLTLEVLESREELIKYLSVSMENTSNTIVYTSAEQVLDRIGDKGKEWYCITYRGEKEKLCTHLTAIKVDNWNDYYLHINMPESYSVNDMTAITTEVCKANQNPRIEPVFRCTCDSSLSADMVEVTIIVPKFDLNWHFGKMWNKQ